MHALLEDAASAGREPWASMHVNGHGAHWAAATRVVKAHQDVWRIRTSGGKPERMTSHDTRVSHLTFLDAKTLVYLATDAGAVTRFVYYHADPNRQIAALAPVMALIVVTAILTSADSLIDASSQLGVSGTVSTSNPEADLTGEPVLSLPGFRIAAEARTRGVTGVEMEALTAVSVAALTVVDMVKAVDKAAVITDVRVETKTGGKSGDWTRP